MMIFSYGTLVHNDIRDKTGRSLCAYPARLRGYVRRWNARIVPANLTALGIEPREDAYINGMVVEYHDTDIAKYDEREWGYERTIVDAAAIDIKKKIHEDVHVYIPKQSLLANEQYPVVQTYLDAAIAGHLEVGHTFAEEFLKTTIDWDRPIVNDRDDPLYSHALSDPPLDTINTLLHAQLCEEDRCSCDEKYL